MTHLFNGDNLLSASEERDLLSELALDPVHAAV